MNYRKGSVVIWVLVALIVAIFAASAMYWYLNQDLIQPITAPATQPQTQQTEPRSAQSDDAGWAGNKYIAVKPVTGSAPLSVQFDVSYPSSVVTGCQDFWLDFGDQTRASTTCSEQRLTHTYTSPGQYTVRYMTQEGDHDTEWDSMTIEVTQ